MFKQKTRSRLSVNEASTMRSCEWLTNCVRGALFLAICSIVCVVSDPLCQETTPFHYDQPQLTCSDFTSADELESNVPDRLTNGKLELVLKDSQLAYIPQSVFQKVKPSTLVLSNVTVRSYRTPDSDTSVFAELRDTLEKLVFHKNSSLPDSWSLLKDNRLLSELLLFRMASLRLGQDFSELPPSVRDVAVVQSTISGVDARWLSSLDNLESLRIDKVDLEKFERTMLPRPASKLKYLTITGTDLSALPEDFGQDLPSLEKLNLRRNKFATIQEAALAPFKSRTVVVQLEGNPLECDCSILFLLGYPDSWQYPNCERPATLAKTPLRQLTPSSLGCTAASPVVKNEQIKTRARARARLRFVCRFSNMQSKSVTTAISS
ncbi:uncharacterized protein LOC119434873 [Dermacentor silvarum]|uniref:uncharacterized protein LOC119434873 n=2 Tax=Dermacentor silvarum TaxID=543639 RepID=UPI002100FBAF|nr:uncharacterized protein LOC119434873 [Dermacentor silvarum]